MIRLLITIAANALGIYLAGRLITGFDFVGNFLELLGTAIIFAIINWVLRPFVKFVSIPFIIVTLGLFIVVINMGMLWLLDLLIDQLVILNLTALILGTLLVSVINLLIVPKKKK